MSYPSPINESKLISKLFSNLLRYNFLTGTFLIGAW